MKMKDFREMDTERLAGRIAELRQEIMNVREAVRSGKEKNHAKLRQLKREMARALTLRREREKTTL
jgi:large subunit ribosomal protein L29